MIDLPSPLRIEEKTVRIGLGSLNIEVKPGIAGKIIQRELLCLKGAISFAQCGPNAVITEADDIGVSIMIEIGQDPNIAPRNQGQDP